MLKAIDSFCHIGKSHITCDDFAYHHSWKYVDTNETVSMAVVLDGCSSSKNTNIGSQLIGTELLKKAWAYSSSYQGLIGLFETNFTISILRNLLENYSFLYGNYFLDSTILIAITNGQDVRIWRIGDGCLAVDKENRTFVLTEFENNAPAYLSYNLDIDRKVNYLKLCNKISVDNGCSVITNTFSDIPILYTDYSAPCTVVLTTDGISSFSNKDEVKSFLDIGTKLLDIKNPNGSFLQRRVNRILEEEAKLGFHNQDDFSGIGIILE